MDIDKGAEAGIELTSEGIRLSLNLLAYILRVTADSLEQNKNIIRNDTIAGKQKIESLLKKHRDGVETLDENLTKQQVKDYQKELKKLGVDFSVVKNGKDNYSFFFASSQASVIEKALKNIIDKEDKEKIFSLKTVKKIDDEIKKKEATKDKTKQIEHSR